MQRMSTRHTELLVGTFIVAGLVLAAGMILFVTDFSLFSSHYLVVVEMEHIGDLAVGAPVKRGGLKIGRVSEISLQKNGIRVVTLIDERVQLTRDVEARTQTQGVVGDTFMEFSQGQSSDPLPQAHTLDQALANPVPGIGSVGMNEILHQVQDIGQEIISITKNVNEIIGDDKVKSDIRETIGNVNATSLEAKRFLKSLNRMSANVELASKDIVATTARIRKISATFEVAINDTIGDKRNREALNEFLGNLRLLSRTLSSRSEQIGTIIETVKELTENANGVMAKGREIVDKVDSDKVKTAVDRLTATLTDASKLISTIRREIAIALVINKGADRIVNEKWDQMKRDRSLRNDPDAMLLEFNRWVKENIKQGYFNDPEYPDREERPYHDVGKKPREEW